MHVVFLLFVLTLAAALPTSLAAQSAPVPADGFDAAALDKITGSVRQVPLTEDIVNRFVVSFPEMQKAGSKFAATQLPDETSSSGMGIFDLDAMPDDKRQELEGIATKHGFKDLKDWTSVAMTAVMTYFSAMQGKRPGAVAEAVDKNIAQAQRDRSMTDEQKQQIIAQYREIGTKLARLEPLKENYELILRMKDEIAPILDRN